MPALAHNPILVFLLISALGMMIGMSKGGFNALGAVVAPLLSLILPVSLAVGVSLPMFIFGDAIAVTTYWRDWDGRLVARMLLPAIAGALVGTYLLSHLPPNVLRFGLAIFVLLLLGYKLVSDRLQSLQYQPHAWHAPAAGGLAGLASGLFNNGGPPFSAYLLLQKLQPRTFTGTTALFFAVINLSKLPGYLYTGVLNPPLLLSYWWVFIFIPLGVWTARQLVARLNRRAFERLIMVLLLLTSLLLLYQSLAPA